MNLYMKSKNILVNKWYVLIIAIFCCLLWGSAYPCIKIGYSLFNIAANDTPTKLVFAGFRFSIAGIVVLLVYFIINKAIYIPKKQQFFKMLILGLLQTTFQYIFFYIGLANTTGVKGSILNSTGIFFSVFLAHFLYKNDKINIFKILGCLVGFLGVIVIEFSTGLSNINFNFYGDGFIIIAAIVASIAAIYSKTLSHSINIIALTGYQLFLGGIILSLAGYCYGGHLKNFTFQSSALLLYMALLSAAAFTLWTALLKYNKVSTISMYNFLIPIFGSLLSALFLNEKIFEVKNLIALILVCFGIFLVNKFS